MSSGQPPPVAAGRTPSTSRAESSASLDPHPTLIAPPAPRSIRVAWLGVSAASAMIVLASLTRSPDAVQALEKRVVAPIAPIAPRLREPAPRDPAAREPTALPPRNPAEAAPSDELNAARLVGVAALAPLAQKYPNDPSVLKALMLAQAGDTAGYAAALTLAKRLFELAPRTAGDDDMRGTLLRILDGPSETAVLAIDTINLKMGAFGADLLFEVANDANAAKAPRERAGKLLESAELRRNASAALLVAVDLKTAATACKRKDFFARARDDGDARALPFLKPLMVTNGCTKMVFTKVDCFECLGGRADLNEAVKAIEARAAKR